MNSISIRCRFYFKKQVQVIASQPLLYFSLQFKSVKEKHSQCCFQVLIGFQSLHWDVHLARFILRSNVPTQVARAVQLAGPGAAVPLQISACLSSPHTHLNQASCSPVTHLQEHPARRLNRLSMISCSFRPSSGTRCTYASKQIKKIWLCLPVWVFG